MLFKWILCILIFIAGFSIGQLKAKSYSNRLFHLEELITFLKVLESEMKYRLDPLPDLLLRLGGTRDGMCASFFITAGSMLKSQNGCCLSESWQEAVETTFRESALNKEDIRIISDMGIELGKTDLENQAGMFRRTFSLLEKQAAEAAEEKRTKGKMYKSLGTAMGILIVIILI